MIQKWKVSNFKSIRVETELEFKPLTIFAGSNSSGKSSFIQTILLVAQTLSYKVSSRSVVLNGHLTKLGQFDDLKSNGGEKDQILIEFSCNHPSKKNSLIQGLRIPSWIYECEILFDSNPSSSQRAIFQTQPRLYSTRLSCECIGDVFGSRSDGKKDEIIINQSHQSIDEKENTFDIKFTKKQIHDSLTYDVKLNEKTMLKLKEENFSVPIGCKMNHFLPNQIICKIDRIKEHAHTIITALSDTGKYLRENPLPQYEKNINICKEAIAVLHDVLKDIIDFDTIADGLISQNLTDIEQGYWVMDPEGILLRELIEKFQELPKDELLKVGKKISHTKNLFDKIHAAMESSENEGEFKYYLDFSDLPPIIADASNYLDNYFSSSLKYLGPLREEPKSLYPLAYQVDPVDIGVRGEYTASVFEIQKSNEVEYIPPENFRTKPVNRKLVKTSLEKAVVDWLGYLGVASSVESRDHGKLGHELKIKLGNSDNFKDLTHVGVGVSQVLPILVMCLLAEPDSVLVFEQPELHLHPKVQTLLGDFFLSMALCDKQCIIETHSEYLINRLRFRIATDSDDKEFSSKTKIYFVEKPEQNSLFREVEINEYGAIIDWPDGFFDQSLSEVEQIILAATMKRKSKREKEHDE